MALKNIRFTRAENLSKDIKDKHSLPSEGLIIIESLNPDLRENFIAIKEGGIREYLLSKGQFIEESPQQ
jgi:hypothetical protein